MILATIKGESKVMRVLTHMIIVYGIDRVDGIASDFPVFLRNSFTSDILCSKITSRIFE